MVHQVGAFAALSEDSSVPSTYIKLAALTPVSGEFETTGLATGHLHTHYT